MTIGHSKVGASGATRWMNCPGSVQASLAWTLGTSSFYAAEGSVAHGVGESRLTGEAVPPIGKEIVYDGHVITVDQAMLDHTAEYEAVVRRYVGNDGELEVEHKFHLKQLHPDLYGTADAVVYKPADKHLIVIDFKYGQGVPVDPDGPQLRYYALGALLERPRPVVKVTLVIHQPRCPVDDKTLREHELPAMELIEWSADLVDAVKATEREDPLLRAGEWCRWCPAAVNCPELVEDTQAGARTEFEKEQPYDPDELARSLTAIPLLEGWIKRVREFAYSEALEGRKPPGFKLVEKRATRNWQNEDEAEVALEMLGMEEDEMFTKRLCTPPAAEKLLKAKGVDLSGFSDLVVKASSGVTLVPESDKRPEYHKATAQEDFS